MDIMTAEHLQHDVFGADPLREFADETNSPDLGRHQIERLAGHGQRYFQAPRPNGKHADRAGGRSMTVGPQQRLAGPAEAFLMDRVADAVARRTVPKAE